MRPVVSPAHLHAALLSSADSKESWIPLVAANKQRCSVAGRVRIRIRLRTTQQPGQLPAAAAREVRSQLVLARRAIQRAAGCPTFLRLRRYFTLAARRRRARAHDALALLLRASRRAHCGCSTLRKPVALGAEGLVVAGLTVRLREW